MGKSVSLSNYINFSGQPTYDQYIYIDIHPFNRYSNKIWEWNACNFYLIYHHLYWCVWGREQKTAIRWKSFIPCYIQHTTINFYHKIVSIFDFVTILFIIRTVHCTSDRGRALRTPVSTLNTFNSSYSVLHLKFDSTILIIVC